VSPAELARVLQADLGHLKRDLKALGATANPPREALLAVVDPGGAPHRHRTVTTTALGKEMLARFGVAAYTAMNDGA
jgi:hypothetical protein